MSAARPLSRLDATADLSFAIRFERHTARGGRFYTMRIERERERQLTLAGERAELGYLLVVIRGGINADDQDVCVVRRAEPWPTLARAVERWGELCTRRRRHGYEEQEQHA